jgi:virulence-associated protein VagC
VIPVIKKLHKQGGSHAIVLPKEFTRSLETDEVMVFAGKSEVIIRPCPAEAESDTMESDPRFQLFIEALYQDALSHPEKLKDSSEAWREFDELMKGIKIDDIGE